MITVKSVTSLPLAKGEGIVEFSNGYMISVRVLEQNQHGTLILTPSKKLVRINPDLTSTVLAEGVSIR